MGQFMVFQASILYNMKLIYSSLYITQIADFGVSEEWTSDLPDTHLRKSAGTRAFAAPETLNGTILQFCDQASIIDILS